MLTEQLACYVVEVESVVTSLCRIVDCHEEQTVLCLEEAYRLILRILFNELNVCECSTVLECTEVRSCTFKLDTVDSYATICCSRNLNTLVDEKLLRSHCGTVIHRVRSTCLDVGKGCLWDVTVLVTWTNEFLVVCYALEEVWVCPLELTVGDGHASESLVNLEAAISTLLAILTWLRQTSVLVALIGSIVLIDSYTVGEANLMTA